VTRLLSLRRVWEQTAVFGVGMGWSPACFIICIGRWVLIVGPHIPSSVEVGP